MSNISSSTWDCPTCYKAFLRKGDLTRHELLHTGVKPFKCEQCGKAFAQGSGLKTHLNVHSGEKPFKCGIGSCKSTFGDPSSRTRHRKETHQGTGAHLCVFPGCKSSIKRRSAYTAHLKKHGIDPATVDMGPANCGSRRACKPRQDSEHTKLNFLDPESERISSSPDSFHQLLSTDADATFVMNNHSSYPNRKHTPPVSHSSTVYGGQTYHAAPSNDACWYPDSADSYIDIQRKSCASLIPWPLSMTSTLPPSVDHPHPLFDAIGSSTLPSFRSSSWSSYPEVPHSHYIGMHSVGHRHHRDPLLMSSTPCLSTTMSVTTPTSSLASTPEQSPPAEGYSEENAWATYDSRITEDLFDTLAQKGRV